MSETDYFSNNIWHLRQTAKALRNDADALIGRADHLTTLADNLERYGQRNTVDGERSG